MCYMTPYYAGAVAGGVLSAVALAKADDPGSRDDPDESGLQFCRLDVHQHVSDTRVALLDRAFHAMRNLVAFMHGHLAIHSNVEIDIKIEAHFSGPTFLNLNDARNGSGSLANGLDELRARSGVHDLVKRGAQKPDAIRRDDGAREKRCPIVRALPALATNQRYRNANKRGSRRKRVAAMMPGIGLHGCALHVAADPVDVTEQKFLYHDYHYQYPERVRSRTMVRQKDFAHTLNCKTNCGGQHPNCNNDSRNRLGFTVTVRMSCVRRPRSDLQPSPDDKRATDVECRLDAVSNQDIGVTEEPAENLCHREN